MKKIALFAAAALCSSVSFAQDAPAVAPEAPVVVPACSPEDAEAMVDEVVAALTEVVEVLESIKDKDSADAAVAKLEAVKTRMDEAQVKMEAMGEPDEATQEKLAAKLLPALFTLAPRMEAAAQNIAENDCYGSEALKALMSEM